MRNHPFYVQHLSHIVWNLADKKVDSGILTSAKSLIVDMNRPFFVREYEALSSRQINLLKAICSGERHLNSEEVLREYRLGTSANVSKNKKALEEQDIIDLTHGMASFIDPVFELWFRQEIHGSMAT